MVRDLHAGFAWFAVVANAVAGSWAGAAHWWPALRHRFLWPFTVAAEVAIGVQVALGVATLSSSDAELNDYHAFYGFVALATVGIVYSYRSQLAAHRYLLYGGSGLFLMGLLLRSLQFSGGS